MRKMREVHAGRWAAELDRATSKLYDLMAELDDLAQAVKDDDDAARGDDAAQSIRWAFSDCRNAWLNAREAVRTLRADVNACPECESTDTDATDLDRAEARRDRICKECDHEWTTRR